MKKVLHTSARPIERMYMPPAQRAVLLDIRNTDLRCLMASNARTIPQDQDAQAQREKEQTRSAIPRQTGNTHGWQDHKQPAGRYVKLEVDIEVQAEREARSAGSLFRRVGSPISTSSWEGDSLRVRSIQLIQEVRRGKFSS